MSIFLLDCVLSRARAAIQGTGASIAVATAHSSTAHSTQHKEKRREEKRKEEKRRGEKRREKPFRFMRNIQFYFSVVFSLWSFFNSSFGFCFHGFDSWKNSTICSLSLFSLEDRWITHYLITLQSCQLAVKSNSRRVHKSC